MSAAPAIAIAGALCAIAFGAGGGLSLSAMTTFEMIATLASGAVVAAAALLAPARARGWGWTCAGLVFVLAALTAVSVAWSVQPDSSWQDAGRMLAYASFFAACVALVRTVPDRWAAVLGGITLAALAVCVYALLTKVFPAAFDRSDVFARLRAPFGYWNATGLIASMGAIACLWLGAKRDGNKALGAMAYPALGVLLVTLLLAYSRGALAALALGVVVWLCIVPLRLRGGVLLLVASLCAALVVGFDFSNHALSSEHVALAERVGAGHELGVLLVAMVIVLAAIGLAIAFLTGRRAPVPKERRALGLAFAALLACGVVALAGGLALSHRGLFGTISHDARSLTDPHAPVPPNTPGRLTAIASVRARYWNEALQTFQAHPALGAGAGGYATARLRYRTETLEVRHAHGYVVQTLADLGLVGLAVTLALFAAWLAAAGRPTHILNRRWSEWRWRSHPLPYTPERVGMLSMLCIVVVFGAHSFVDWTWYVPGDACIALLCAGWLAGRGPLDAAGTSTWRSWRELDAVRATMATTAILAALVFAWAQWQPQRSAAASQQALADLAVNRATARAAAQSAVSRDPLSAQALLTLAAVQQASGEASQARATLAHAVHVQPSNPQTWQALGEHDLSNRLPDALNELRAALFLNPESVTVQNAYVEALRAKSGP